MKPLIAITQRIDRDPRTDERRSGLDVHWANFLSAAGLDAIALPNHLAATKSLWHRLDFAGVVLSGGNDLHAYGGDAPERDAVELFLIEYCISNRRPLIGVCRGMQMIQHYFGTPLEKISGHVTSAQQIKIHDEVSTVNSYHTWGARSSSPAFEIWAQADDGVIKAVRHRDLPMTAMMWHPERFAHPVERDLRLFRQWFRSSDD